MTNSSGATFWLMPVNGKLYSLLRASRQNSSSTSSTAPMSALSGSAGLSSHTFSFGAVGFGRSGSSESMYVMHTNASKSRARVVFQSRELGLRFFAGVPLPFPAKRSQREVMKWFRGVSPTRSSSVKGLLVR